MDRDMNWAVSSRWNGRRHREGQALVDEILELGFSGLELGYDFRRELAEGVRRRVEEGAVRVPSVHSFCPIPMGVPRGHPELWTLAHPEAAIRRKAVQHLRQTAEFAAEMGATAMVVHGGYVPLRPLTPRLISLLERGREGGWWWNRTWAALDRRRERHAPETLARLREGLAELAPALASLRVRLALENLPNLESVPAEREAGPLIEGLNSPWIGLWYDFGHGQIRENLGYVNAPRMLERCAPWLAGFHVHDVAPPAQDHLPPGRGSIGFDRFTEIMRAHPDLPRVIEPQRDVSPEELRRSLAMLRGLWEDGGKDEKEDRREGSGVRGQAEKAAAMAPQCPAAGTEERTS
jgi:sugar phosphate isomerase/epimerase